jgi:DNA polymerase III epsilon subunit-like protein
MDYDWIQVKNLIFVDTESTGLSDDENSEIVELTWVTLDGEPETLYFGVQVVPPFIDNLIGFTKRGIAGRRSDHFAIERFLTAADGNTMVAANPSHDKHFIEKAGLWRFHYRMLDIESYAMAKFDLSEMPGMKAVHDYLASEGFEMANVPDHTSRGDVLAMRDAYLVMKNFYGSGLVIE